MNETLQNAVAELITSSVASVEAAKNFVLAEAPDVIQQLIAWNLAENLIYWVIGVILLFLVAPICAKTLFSIFANSNNDNHWAYNEDIAVPIGLICMVSFVLSIVIGLCETLDIEWIKIWLAPKVWLIEYAADLVK